MGINKYEVINLGVPGYDIKYSVERFRIRGEKYNPDLVIWQLGDDDFTQIAEVLNKKKKERTGSFDDHHLNMSAAIKVMEIELGKENIDQYQKVALAEITNHYIGPLIIVSINGIHGSSVEVLNNFLDNRPHTYFFDNQPDLAQTKYRLKDDHPNVAGHDKLAHQLYDHLTDNNVINCTEP